MLIKENSIYLNNIMDLLNNSTYLNYRESINSSTIPVLENKRLNIWTVDYDYINEFSETYGYLFSEVIDILKEENQLDQLFVAINDVDILEDCSIINGINDYVIKPTKKYFSTLLEEVLLEIKIDPNEIDAEFKEIKSVRRSNEFPSRLASPGIIDVEFKEIEIDKNEINNIGKSGIDVNRLREKLDEINRKFDEELKRKIEEYNNSEEAKENKKKLEEINKKIADLKASGSGNYSSSGGSSYGGGSYSSPRTTYKTTSNKVDKNDWGYKADKWCRDKIEKLQSIYKSFLEKAKKEKDQNKAGFFKKIAYYVLLYIDKFLNFVKDGLFDLKKD